MKSYPTHFFCVLAGAALLATAGPGQAYQKVKKSNNTNAIGLVILRNDSRNYSRDVHAGEPIVLGAGILNASGVSGTRSPKWSIAGKKVDGFTATPDVGHEDPYELQDEWNLRRFYWADGGNTAEPHNVSFTADYLRRGSWRTATANVTFQVKKPGINLWGVTSSVNLFPPADGVPDVVKFHGMHEFEVGIKFYNTGNESTLWGGTTTEVQIVNSCTRKAKIGTRVYDYPNDFGVDADATEWEYGADVDSPFQPLSIYTSNDPLPLLPQPVDSMEVDQQFTRWLMWKSPRPGSIWVPTAKMDWFWKATSTSNPYTLDSRDWSHDPTGAATDTYPQWTKHELPPSSTTGRTFDLIVETH